MKNYLILFSLVLALIVQVFNTSALYSSGSNLIGLENQIAGYFIGISAEFAIFICILSGSRAAGGWFAILSFFVGILFHDHWSEFVLDIPHFPDNWYLISKHKAFYSTTLLQIINSALVWFLSELYVEKQQKAAGQQTLADLEQNITAYEQKTAQAQQDLTDLEQERKRKLSQLENISSSIIRRNIEEKEAEKRKAELEQEIISLQKRKAGMSRNVSPSNQ
jgi:hypothetical protein